MSDSASESAAGSGRTRWRAYWVCVGVAALTILDLSKINVGLPSIEASLHGGPTELQLIVAGYALAFGLALVPSGRLGDLHSRKLMFVVGLSAFTAASLLCAIAPTIEMLVVARVLQGVAAGIQMPQVLGMVQQLFQGPERGRAFGLFGASIGLATAFGPTLGGLLIGLGGPVDGWRLLFWMNIPLGIAALVVAVRLLPARQRRERGRGELDLVGILLLGVATFSFMLPFVLTTGSDRDDPVRWLWLLLSLVAAASFVAWERRYLASGRSPVVHFSLFRTSSYRNGILIAASFFAAVPAVFLLTTLFLQIGLGLEPVYAGMATIPFALASAFTSWLGGRLINRVGRPLVVGGLVLLIVGIVAALLFALSLPAPLIPWFMATALGVAGAGGGFVISPNQTLTLAEVPVTMGGVAGSIGQVGQRVGTAVGTAAAASTFFATLSREPGVEHLAAYSDALRNGYLIALGLLALGLLLGLVDLRVRRAGP